jgi:hypothetical protein
MTTVVRFAKATGLIVLPIGRGDAMSAIALTLGVPAFAGTIR